MITKAVIMGTPKNGDNLYRVRIPLFETTGNSSDLVSSSAKTYEATLCKTPGNTDGYNIGDVVFVGFENNKYSEVTILGKLYTGEAETYKPKQELSVLGVDGTVELNGNVSVNGVDMSNLGKNIQAIENLQQYTKEISKKVDGNNLFNIYGGPTRWRAVTSSDSEAEILYYSYTLSPLIYPEVMGVKATDVPIWDINVDPENLSVTYKNQIKYRSWCTTLKTYDGYLELYALKMPTETIILETKGLSLIELDSEGI